MKNVGRASASWVAIATILLCPLSLVADTIISVTAPPSLSSLIESSFVVSTSWSQSDAYTNATIAVLVNSALVGEMPTAEAYLTTSIGPGTTTADEIAQTQFTVPGELPVCSPFACGALVTLFSGLSLSPRTYFLTLGPHATSNGTVGWFPALNPTVIEDTGVAEGASFFSLAADTYAPASAFEIYSEALNYTVTGTSAIPEPRMAPLIGLAALFLCGQRWRNTRRRGPPTGSAYGGSRSYAVTRRPAKVDRAI